MSIRINKDKCKGCLACTQVCPGNLIYENEGRVYMKYPNLCWGCAACLKECSFGAIDYFLGADIGGTGAVMNISQEDGLLLWNIRKPGGETVTIRVDSHGANSY